MSAARCVLCQDRSAVPQKFLKRVCICSAEAELNLVAGRSRSVGKVEYLHLNLASFRSISNFVTEFNKKNLPLHILANNAAVWMTEDQMTEDGFEVHATKVNNHKFMSTITACSERVSAMHKQSMDAAKAWHAVKH